MIIYIKQILRNYRNIFKKKFGYLQQFFCKKPFSFLKLDSSI